MASAILQFQLRWNLVIVLLVHRFYGNNEYQHLKGLQPELFFKMPHEIYNYGERLDDFICKPTDEFMSCMIGKVAADRSHKYVYKEETKQAINFFSGWYNPGDSGSASKNVGSSVSVWRKVREGVIQLGSLHKVVRVGLNVDFAPDLVANQLDIRNGALILQSIMAEYAGAVRGVLSAPLYGRKGHIMR
ncbi:Serine/threonine-protein kinase WNK (With No Lysine)-like protein [Thalictrum thalictroides]|uniref:Serine/threonine-protein kinase WNK (With No Lysine)-like protein n=1 Tax=Thalictrum thalictroides TaxID=46969 RepID=A0A7J6V445_THATH|nr:Serine/threonine-protein kinase WNK (With No Lysine)-like protein [Thalictrum thalictroides]